MAKKNRTQGEEQAAGPETPAAQEAAQPDQLSELLVSEAEPAAESAAPEAPSLIPDSGGFVNVGVKELAKEKIDIPFPPPREPQDSDEAAALARGETLSDEPVGLGGTGDPEGEVHDDEGFEEEHLPPGAVILAGGTRLSVGGHEFTLLFDAAGVLAGVSDEQGLVSVLSKDRANYEANKHLFGHDYNPVTGARIEGGEEKSKG